MVEQNKWDWFPQPVDPLVAVWRYMDFAKLVAMLEHNGIFFARGDLLGDPFEGALPAGTVLDRQRDKDFTDEDMAYYARRALYVRKWSLISCWHLSEYESAAMWRLYAWSKEAVAIRSTYKKLKEFADVHQVQIGMVRYIDYTSDVLVPRLPDGLHRLWHKRLSFSHEREVRIVWHELPKNYREDREFQFVPLDAGRWFAADLPRLIDAVHVAPESADWFDELVTGVVKRYGLGRPVVRSSLCVDPVF